MCTRLEREGSTNISSGCESFFQEVEGLPKETGLRIFRSGKPRMVSGPGGHDLLYAQAILKYEQRIGAAHLLRTVELNCTPGLVHGRALAG